MFAYTLREPVVLKISFNKGKKFTFIIRLRHSLLSALFLVIVLSSTRPLYRENIRCFTSLEVAG